MTTRANFDTRTDWRREIAADLAFIRYELAQIVMTNTHPVSYEQAIEDAQIVANQFRQCDRLEAESRSMLQVVR